MPGGLVAGVDDEGLLEYSVVYTDRALNHMSKKFQKVMNDIDGMLKEVYSCHASVIIPGSGTYGMEAVARQFGTGKKCMVVRMGLFSFRWTQIFDAGSIPSESLVLKARRISEEQRQHPGPLPFVPPPIEEVTAAIASFKPDVIFMPHVETSSGMILPNEYIKACADAVHAHGGRLVLDCIASGGLWINMKELGVDVLCSAPQKGWCGPACCAFVLLNESTRAHLDTTTSTSFTIDLKKWASIMDAYTNGGHAYHATMPTDALCRIRDVMQEIKAYGFPLFQQKAVELGLAMRKMLEEKGHFSVAHSGFQSPTVVVNFTTNAELKTGKMFAMNGFQIAGGVPLQCDEGPDYSSYRLGLFGLEKHQNVDRTVQTLKDGFETMGI